MKPVQTVLAALVILALALLLPSAHLDAYGVAPAHAESGALEPALAPAATPPAGPPVRGVKGDLWADLIIGQRDFSQFTPNEVVPYKVFNPSGVIVDRSVSPGRAYVWDGNNSRVLGLDLATCYANPGACQASVVLGQPSGWDNSACNGDSGFQNYPNRAPASASTLCGIPEDTLSILENKSQVSMAVDASGNLYVPDVFNNRVLKYISPFTTDTVADEVWGQADFTGNACNRGMGTASANTLCFWDGSTGGNAGVELDAAGNLWIADTANHRVLRFPKDTQSGVIAKTADMVLGQSNFSGRTAGGALNQMANPGSLRFAPSGALYVLDPGYWGNTDNRRILVFEPPFSTGMSANRTFGQNFQSVDSSPTSLEVDPEGAGVWVLDARNSMLELWDWDGVTVKKVLGKDTYRLGREGGSVMSDALGGFGFDTSNNLLTAHLGYIQDVLRFPAPIPTPQTGVVYQADKTLFSPPYSYNLVSTRRLPSLTGVATYGNQLIVADGSRLLFWNDVRTLINGQSADGFIGQTDFQYQPTCCLFIKPDASRLWVIDNYGNVDTYPLPLTVGASPTRVINAQATLSVLGGGSLTLKRNLDGLAPLPDGSALWLSDHDNHRVIRIRNPLTTPVVDVVLGQTTPSGTLCNRGQVTPPISDQSHGDMLCSPGSLSLDRLGNLFVSDHSLEVEGNYRLLEFDQALFPPNPATALFAPSATKIFPYQNAQPSATFETAFDSANRMAVGYNGYLGGRFVGVYADPLGPSLNPSAYLGDYSSMPYKAAFDQYDNLYVAEQNRMRVLIYKGPFNLPLPTAVKPAVFRQGTWFLRDSLTTGGAQQAFSYGTASDIPLMCDWDGNGSRTVGVYRPSTSTFYLRNTNTTGVSDLAFVYGAPGDVPVCGDWDLDGVQTIGVYRPSNSVFYLRNSNTTGVADTVVLYGQVGDTPVVGDWDGDGRDTVGVRRGASWYLRNSNTTGASNVAYTFGLNSDVPLPGEWDGANGATAGVFRQGAWFLRNSHTTGAAEVQFTFGAAGDIPLVWK